MELKGEFEIKSDRHTVSSFISDIDQVTSIIPEVQSAEKLNETSSKLVVKAGKSAIKGKFNLLLELKQITEGEDIDIYARGSGTTGSLDLKANYKLVDLGSSTLFPTKSACSVFFQYGSLKCRQGQYWKRRPQFSKIQNLKVPGGFSPEHFFR